jgi:carboxypeptidase D
LCTGDETFPGPAGTNSKGDLSESPAQSGVLQTLIERTNNVVIANGDQDSLLSTNGTLLAIQNITWNGFQGFQTKPVNDFQVPYHREYSIDAQSGAGIAGKWGTERGLTFASVHLGGHSKSKAPLIGLTNI